MNELTPLQPSKHADYFKNYIPDPDKRREYLSILQGRALPERYAQNHLSVALSLVPKRNVELAAQGRTELHDRSLSTSSPTILKLHALNPSDTKGRDKGEVFVVDVEIVKGHKFGVPSTAVWLDVSNQKLEEGSPRVYFSAFERSFKVSRVIEDSELVMGVDGIGESKFKDGDPCDIESTPKIVKSVSKNEREVALNRSVVGLVMEDLLPGLRIECLSGTVSVTCLSDALLQIDDVLLGPLDL